MDTPAAAVAAAERTAHDEGGVGGPCAGVEGKEAELNFVRRGRCVDWRCCCWCWKGDHFAPLAAPVASRVATS